LVALGLLVLGLLQPVGRGVAQRLGFAQLRQQRAAPRLDLVWRLLQGAAFAERLLAPLVERCNLLLRVLGARQPVGAIGGDRGTAAVALLGVALQPVMARARVAQCAALALHLAGRVVERRLQRAEVGRMG